MPKETPRQTILYYQSLHSSISEQTGFTPQAIQSIRRLYSQLKDRQQVAFHLVKQTQKPKQKRDRSTEYYQNLLNIVASCPQDKWEILVQPDDLHKES
jgi:hypothetical protein